MKFVLNREFNKDGVNNILATFLWPLVSKVLNLQNPIKLIIMKLSPEKSILKAITNKTKRKTAYVKKFFLISTKGYSKVATHLKLPNQFLNPHLFVMVQYGTLEWHHSYLAQIVVSLTWYWHMETNNTLSGVFAPTQSVHNSIISFKTL